MLEVELSVFAAAGKGRIEQRLGEGRIDAVAFAQKGESGVGFGWIAGHRHDSSCTRRGVLLRNSSIRSREGLPERLRLR